MKVMYYFNPGIFVKTTTLHFVLTVLVTLITLSCTRRSLQGLLRSRWRGAGAEP